MEIISLIDDPRMRTLLIAAATIVVVFVLLRALRALGALGKDAEGRSSRRFGTAAGDQSGATVPNTSVVTKPPKPAIFDDWEVRMHETARELIGRIDAKLAALRALTEEADRAARRLERALAAARDKDRAVETAESDSGASAQNSRASPMGEAGAANSAKKPLDMPTAADQTRVEPNSSASTPTRQRRESDQADALRAAGDANGIDLSALPPSESRRFDEIYLLSDYGFDAAEIAHRTGVPIGEVELILRLRGRSG